MTTIIDIIITSIIVIIFIIIIIVIILNANDTIASHYPLLLTLNF